MWPCLLWQVTDRELKEFQQAQLAEQSAIMNSAIDIPKRKDKEDLTESSEVSPELSLSEVCAGCYPPLSDVQ